MTNLAEMLEKIRSVAALAYKGAKMSQVSRGRIHSTIQSAINALAPTYALIGIMEYPLTYNNDKHGDIDVVWLRAKSPVVCIEIDSSIRRKSWHKLLALEAEAKIWIYYGRKDWRVIREIDSHRIINVISLNR